MRFSVVGRELNNFTELERAFLAGLRIESIRDSLNLVLWMCAGLRRDSGSGCRRIERFRANSLRKSRIPVASKRGPLCAKGLLAQQTCLINFFLKFRDDVADVDVDVDGQHIHS